MYLKPNIKTFIRAKRLEWEEHACRPQKLRTIFKIREE